jgi:hypothetical protein
MKVETCQLLPQPFVRFHGGEVVGEFLPYILYKTCGTPYTGITKFWKRRPKNEPITRLERS